jgi:hypothetical protein
MSALRPCIACKRHVRIAASSCPFCAAALPPGRAQYVRPGAFTRAAVFSAALAGCSDHKQPPPPAPGSAQQGSDDLENLLDQQPRTADHPTPDAGAIDADVAVAATPDAAVAVDAGIDPQVLAAKKKVQEERRRRLEAEKRLRDQLLREQQVDVREMAKPYGAPPARRRVV